METKQQIGQNSPLAGVKVLDLGQIYQGPYASFLLAKAGANVIKVEPPKGEPSRLRAKIGRGASLPMVMLNTNKRGITLNLKTEKGRDLLKEIVLKADVLVENYAPGVLDRLGVGWSVLHEANPRLIYASATGYGLSGPDRDNLAMDLTVQAVSGIMSITGMPDGPPMRAGPSICDFLGGVHLFAGIMMALYERSTTGIGRLVEVAMEEAVYPTLASNLGLLYSSGTAASLRVGNRHGGLALAPYNVYRAKDGFVAIICVVEDHWAKLVAAMGRDELREDPRFATNQLRVANLSDTDRVVEEWTSNMLRADIFKLTSAHRVPSAPVRDLDEVMNDPHMHARGMLEWFDDPDLGRVVLPSTPIRLHGTDQVAMAASPLLGEHNEEVYSEWLGLSPTEMEKLRQDGVI
ncbi:CaiB/BaiF CoA transferase family protein [Candidatus Nitrotoga sp. M5]|uniref:CaiB/BaiF CoA transferase family protein n=1 Tax=Candidatus Nitrotoga sp. M5 TaxID=2890409 RepID=UPI001EF47A2B|nr:CoA transferase [Candidatus Nitrotoga sp. M5]CAH1387503.1 CoA transferase [Candidatus Nitrotoga sp. M5]